MDGREYRRVDCTAPTPTTGAGTGRRLHDGARRRDPAFAGAIYRSPPTGLEGPLEPPPAQSDVSLETPTTVLLSVPPNSALSDFSSSSVAVAVAVAGPKVYWPVSVDASAK